MTVLAALCCAAAVVVAAAAVRRPLPARTLPAHARARAAAAVPRTRRPVVLAAGGVLAGAVAIAAGPFLAVAAAATTWGWRSLRRRRLANAAARAVESSMPDATELLVACLHAGRSPTQAVLELVRLAPLPLRPAFAAVEQRLHRGSGLADALGELTTRCGRCALPLVTAMSAAVRDGLPLAPVLDRLTDEANASRRRQGEAAARRLPVRLSFPLVACTLPSFVLLAIAPAILGAISSLRDSPL